MKSWEYGKKKNNKAIGQSNTRRSRQGNGEAESRYVCKRVKFRFVLNEVLVVENDVEQGTVNL
jgi:hypothetical protein